MKTTHLVTLVVTACIAIAAWAMLQGQTASVQGAQRSPLVTAEELPIEHVNRIELERSGAPAMSFERTDQGWMQTKPYAHPGDAVALRQVIDVAAGLEQSRGVNMESLDAAARAALGLDPPQATLRFAWPGGERVLQLGRRTVAGRAWVRVLGRPDAASVDSTLHALAVEGDPRQWRSVALYDPLPGEAERIVLKYGSRSDAEWIVERHNGRWRLVAPFKTRADGEAVRAYIEAIARAQADAFAADQPADFAAFGLSPPEARVQIVRSAGAPAAKIDVGVNVTQGSTERFGRVDDRPAVLQLGTKALAALLPPPAFFIDARGTDVAPPDVRRIEFTPASGVTLPAFALDRARDAWTVRSADGQGTPANADAVRRLLTQLAETRAPAVSFNEVPDGMRLGQFTLVGEGGAALAVIRVARESNDGTGKWALDNEDGVLRVFPQNFDPKLDAASYMGSR